MKICNTCKLEKSLDDFANDKSKKTGKSNKCKQCAIEYSRKYYAKKTGNEFTKHRKFIRDTADLKRKLYEKHDPDLYDYSITIFVDKYTPIQYICKIHGIVEQPYKNHLKIGCPYCRGWHGKSNKKVSEEEFKERNKGRKYDYDKVVFTQNIHDLVIIGCPDHGDFPQRAYAHLYGAECPKCANEQRGESNRKKTDEFITELPHNYLDLYDYTHTIYKNRKTKIIYFCKICQRFVDQNPVLHVRAGCQYCNGRGESKHNFETFSIKGHKRHKNFYIYDKVSFNTIQDKVIIVCPKHGDFEQQASAHINNGAGCPKCALENNVSYKQKEIQDFIEEYYNGEILSNYRGFDHKETDIYMPKLKIGIEYHSHYYHRHQVLEDVYYHKNKADIAQKYGFKLFQIFEKDWANKKDIVKSRILNALGLSNRIYARKCKIVSITHSLKKDFLNQHHIQGNDSTSTVYYGLTYENELVACMTFGAPRYNKKYKWELVRFCSKKNTTILGGAGRLLSHFKNKHEGSIISYADRCWSNGDLYNQLGFKLLKINDPGYFYFHVANKKILSRLKCRKHNLRIFLPKYDDDLSQEDLMTLNGYDKIYDAGSLRYVIE